MADEAGTEQETKSAQALMFRLAARDHQLTLAVLMRETGIDVRPYARENIFARAKMPLWVFVELCKVIPDDVTSVMLEGAGKRIASEEPVDGDAHALARDGSEYNVAYLNATDPASELGPELSHRERAQLHDIHRRMKARKVA